MKKHIHNFKTARSGKVDICACGRFRFNNKSGDFIVGIPQAPVKMKKYKITWTETCTAEKDFNNVECKNFNKSGYYE